MQRKLSDKHFDAISGEVFIYAPIKNILICLYKHNRFIFPKLSNFYFLDFLKTYYPDVIKNRYNVEILDDYNETLIKIGESLHFYLGNKDVDIDKTALYVLQEYRNDYLGKMTLDRL